MRESHLGGVFLRELSLAGTLRENRPFWGGALFQQVEDLTLLLAAPALVRPGNVDLQNGFRSLHQRKIKRVWHPFGAHL